MCKHIFLAIVTVLVLTNTCALSIAAVNKAHRDQSSSQAKGEGKEMVGGDEKEAPTEDSHEERAPTKLALSNWLTSAALMCPLRKFNTKWKGISSDRNIQLQPFTSISL
ncbi:hypothetical protein PsorP6_016321 [Peronosclerospora sorghi]|uniref:Uncharacterized protein n=1 Tax=Peronosclerospora sorghi TaxID=230839 RepID=A0ACC0VND5_9STRA|nr:hypothetical protein PsorP6_016321 [Peronosclerospora sorghi]